MRKPTELMREILTNEMAQRIIDYVSPIYGNSYVGLWIYEAIGFVLSEVYEIANQLQYETTPATADLLLDCWERQYGVPTDSSLTKEQRRKRIITKKQSKGPCNPKRIADAVSSALGGVEVDVTENADQNKFLVNVREVIPSLLPAVAVIERMKPAHLIYEIRVAMQTVSDADLKIAIAITHAEMNKVEVF